MVRYFASLYEVRLLAKRIIVPHTVFNSSSNSIDVIVSNYQKKLETESSKITKKYLLYLSSPDSHPRYGEEWKEYWLNEYNKTGGKVAGDVNSRWKTHWIQRLKGLEQEDNLQLRVDLKKLMDLPIIESELNDYEKLMMTRKAKINKIMHKIEKSEETNVATTPLVVHVEKTSKMLIDLDEISQNVKILSKANVIQANSTVPHEDEKLPDIVIISNEPISVLNFKSESEDDKLSRDIINSAAERHNALENCSTSDLANLLSSYDSLDGDLKIKLSLFLKKLEKEDVDRYLDIIKNPSPEIKTENVFQFDDDEADDYPLEGSMMMKNADENAKPIVISDDEEQVPKEKSFEIRSVEAEIIEISDDEMIEE